jgi:hypothetical protein
MTRDLISLDGVFAVPPLARSAGHGRAIDFEQNSRIVRYIAQGGISRFIYGGNAFLYHSTLAEYEQLLDWQANMQRDGQLFLMSAGPSYGRLMDQAPLLRRFAIPCVMILPCGDPRDATGLERGLREFAEAAGVRLMKRTWEAISWLVSIRSPNWLTKGSALRLNTPWSGTIQGKIAISTNYSNA